MSSASTAQGAIRLLKIPTTSPTRARQCARRWQQCASSGASRLASIRRYRARHHGGHQRGARAQGRQGGPARHRRLCGRAGDRPQLPPQHLRPCGAGERAGVPRAAAPAQRRGRAHLRAGRDRHAARCRVAARRHRLIAGAEGRRDRRRLPLFLRQPGARARGRAGDRRDGAGGDGLALLRHRSRVPRIRAHQHHRLRRLREAGARPLPRRDGARPRGVRRERAAAGDAVARRPRRLVGGAAPSGSPVSFRSRGRCDRRPGGRPRGRARRPHHLRHRRHQLRHRAHPARRADHPVRRRHRRLPGARADGRRQRDRRRRRQHRVDRQRRRLARRAAVGRRRSRPGLLRSRREGGHHHRCLAGAGLPQSRTTLPAAACASTLRLRRQQSRPMSPGRSVSRCATRRSACGGCSTPRWPKAFAWCRSAVAAIRAPLRSSASAAPGRCMPRRWPRNSASISVIVPRFPGVLSACGLLCAPTEHEVSAACHRNLAGHDPRRGAGDARRNSTGAAPS